MPSPGVLAGRGIPSTVPVLGSLERGRSALGAMPALPLGASLTSSGQSPVLRVLGDLRVLSWMGLWWPPACDVHVPSGTPVRPALRLGRTDGGTNPGSLLVPSNFCLGAQCGCFLELQICLEGKPFVLSIFIGKNVIFSPYKPGVVN